MVICSKCGRKVQPESISCVVSCIPKPLNYCYNCAPERIPPGHPDYKGPKK